MRSRAFWTWLAALGAAISCDRGRVPTCDAVTAYAGPGGAVHVGSTVVASAEGSTSSDGAPLVFAWSLVGRPTSSRAALSAAAGPQVSFLADAFGTYTLQLSATGSCTATTTVAYQAGDEPPVAVVTASPPGPTFVGTPVTLSASASFDPDGDPLDRVSWTLSPPAGSAAQVGDSTAWTTAFVPDLAGTYRIELSLMDAFRFSRGYATVTVVDATFRASVPSALYGNVGRPVAAEADATAGFVDPRLASSWALTVRPAASAATLTARDGLATSFTPDVPGDYGLALTVSGAGGMVVWDVPVTVWPRAELLPYVPVDAQYDRALDRIVLVSTTPAELHVRDPFTGDDRSVALPLAPDRVALSPDGKVAAVLHEGAVSIVDLESLALVHVWPISEYLPQIAVTDVADGPGGPTRFVAIIPDTDQIPPLVALDVETGVEVAGSSAERVYFAGAVAALPGAPRLLVLRDLEPTTVLAAEIRADGTPFFPAYYSGYRGWCGRTLWPSEDASQAMCFTGTRILLDGLVESGRVAALSTGRGLWSADAPAPPSLGAGRWLLQPKTGAGSPGAWRDDTEFLELDSATLGDATWTALWPYGDGPRWYPLHGRIVAFDRAGEHRVMTALLGAEFPGERHVVVLVL